jgi:3-phosphoshikimate 1-carboxyvinyltransferase
MKVTIEPGSVHGSVIAPPSKSMTQRAYAAALLHKGKTIIRNAGHSDDERAAVGIIQQLGAKITTNGSVTDIVSSGVNPVSASIDCGESGLAARLFTPIAGLSGDAITISGMGSLLGRPMDGFADVLPQLNVALRDFDVFLPLIVQGPMEAKSIKVNGENGSQFLSGLLFAVSSCAKGPVAIEVTELKSKPYIDLTLEVLSHFGKPIRHSGYAEFYIDPSLFVHKDTVEIDIEGDWSSAAYMLVAGAIAGEVTVRNIRADSRQADAAIIEVLQYAGARMSITDEGITVRKSQMKAFDFDATDQPDLFPVLAILAACCEGESYITGVHRLFNKESNRAESICDLLVNFDVPFSISDDILFVNGVNRLQGTVIDAHNDHRIVMAAAIGALRANGPVDILGAEAVNKSYPDFFRDLPLNP